MSVPDLGTGPSLPDLAALLAEGERAACCAAIYEQPAVRWLLGDELHPGGEDATRRALDLIEIGPGRRLLDVASGAGTSALLAARERGCEVVGLEYGEGAVAGAREAAAADKLDDRVEFVRGDAGALPFADGEFDAVLCECSLCTFADKPRAAAEIARVLRPGGRLALADVVAEPGRLPAGFDGVLAAIACVGEAMPERGYRALLAEAGLDLLATESLDAEADALAGRIEDRLRGARLLGLDRLEGSPVGTADAIELVRAARRAITDGALGYAILVAERPITPPAR